MGEREAPNAEGKDAASEGAHALRPVTEKQRLTSVDVLRGFALLGILAMNIVAFSLPFAAYANPTVMGGFQGLDRLSWIFNHFIFEQKFMALFSMLYGAGLILMWERAREKGRPMTSVWYKRNLWLAIIGTLHGYLLWMGDILFGYAVCGFLIYPFRRMSPRNLALLGILAMMAAPALMHLAGTYFSSLKEPAAKIQAKRERGEGLSDQEQATLDTWAQNKVGFHPSPEQLQESVNAHLGSYRELVAFRAPLYFSLQTGGLLAFVLWRAGGLMLLGMALMKWGVLSASLSKRAYLRLLAAGYLAGFPLVALSAWVLIEHDFYFLDFLRADMLPNYIGAVPVALGHLALVMLACKSDALTSLKGRLAAVGRMAFTNYLMHSVILTTAFYGYGLGYFGQFSRSELWFFVLGVWALQLWYSPLWLRRFRFGPAEWLWRTLTYAQVQPLRR